MKARILDRLDPTRVERQEAFANILGLAQELHTRNRHALPALITALLRPLQSSQIAGVIERGENKAPSEVDRFQFFTDDVPAFRETQYCVNEREPVVLDLAFDVVLMTPWIRARTVGALAEIGHRPQQKAWRQDSNHIVVVWLPWRIGFVAGGNHSIAAGILTGRGELEATDVYDFSPLLREVGCDGKTYSYLGNGERVAPVTDTRRAAVYEIGRLMIGS